MVVKYYAGGEAQANSRQRNAMSNGFTDDTPISG
jgi:hypothetical protein